MAEQPGKRKSRYSKPKRTQVFVGFGRASEPGGSEQGRGNSYGSRFPYCTHVTSLRGSCVNDTLRVGRGATACHTTREPVESVQQGPTTTIHTHIGMAYASYSIKPMLTSQHRATREEAESRNPCHPSWPVCRETPQRLATHTNICGFKCTAWSQVRRGMYTTWPFIHV